MIRSLVLGKANTNRRQQSGIGLRDELGGGRGAGERGGGDGVIEHLA